jgi:UDP:flavonoid glycosyltransferase YjiC (YdhE family)
MRVLFTSHGAAPHLFPMVPLAWAFRAAGHEVRIASQSRIRDVLVRNGIPAFEITGAPQWTEEQRRETVDAIYRQGPWPPRWATDLRLLNDDQRAYLEFIGRRLIATAEAMADELIEVGLAWRPDLIVYDQITFAGEVAAARLGVPAVRHLCGTVAFPRAEFDTTGEPLAEYAELFSSRGLPMVRDPQAFVDTTPPSMRVATEPNTVDVRYVPYNGPGIVPAWLAEPAHRPRVCVTWGHTAALALGGEASRPFLVALEAIAELDVEIVVVTTAAQIEQLTGLPPGTRTAASAPLHLILPYCDVLVQQGGDGTTLTAAACGVPQLAISRKPDAEVSPGQLVGVGAGIHLRYQEMRDDPDAKEIIRNAVEQLLVEPRYSDAARRLREEIESQPAPAEVVPTLTALAGQ